MVKKFTVLMPGLHAGGSEQTDQLHLRRKDRRVSRHTSVASLGKVYFWGILSRLVRTSSTFETQ